MNLEIFTLKTDALLLTMVLWPSCFFVVFFYMGCLTPKLFLMQFFCGKLSPTSHKTLRTPCLNYFLSCEFFGETAGTSKKHLKTAISIQCFESILRSSYFTTPD